MPDQVTLPPLHHDQDSDANAGMEQIKKEIVSIGVVKVNVVGVSPLDGPGVNDLKPVAAVLKARLTFDDDRTVDHESVLAAELGVELIIRNMAAALEVPLTRGVIAFSLLTNA